MKAKRSVSIGPPAEIFARAKKDLFDHSLILFHSSQYQITLCHVPPSIAEREEGGCWTDYHCFFPIRCSIFSNEKYADGHINLQTKRFPTLLNQ